MGDVRMRQYFDRQLNNVSMYYLMTIILAGLAVMSLILSAASLLPVHPLAIIVTILVFLFSVGITSWLVGYAFCVRAHGESSIITALILFFIFTPTLEPKMIAIYVLVGMIAGASKFLLAWRGRHIFNPAAVAAVIIGLTTITHASWWVATPWLFMPTLIGALVIFHKTGRMLMGLMFITISSVLFVISQLLYGESIEVALTLILSWPIVFFGGYMLTEPLTLPKKKWQAVGIAAVLGVMIAIPFRIGELAIVPATALVLANLASALLNRRQAITLRYTGSRDITPSSKELFFRASKPVQFEAGQYIELTLPHDKTDARGYRRYFSITSVPGDDKVSVAMKFYTPSSTFKQSILSLKKNTTITSTGTYGSFTLPRQTDKKLLLIAGGIGITPFISQLRTLAAQRQHRDIVLIYTASSPSELAYMEELAKFGVKIFVVTPDKATLGVEFMHITSPHIDLEQLISAGVDLSDRQAYISGPPAFVRTIKKRLKHYGLRNIKTDYFTGY